MLIVKHIIILFILISSPAFSNKIPHDIEYYKKGIENYKSGNFPEAYIIFFNLASKGDRDAQYNLANMYSSGIGTPQDFKESLKWTWMCSLGGEKKCIKKIPFLKNKLDKKTFEDVGKRLGDSLEKLMYKDLDIHYALKLGFWHEKFSPNIDLEKAYLWYSISVSGGLYKAMKVRDRVENKIPPENIIKLQSEANKIYKNIKFFPKNEGD